MTDTPRSSHGSAPVRVQRKRTKGWKMPPNTVSVTRPGKWGNPFVVGKPYATIAGSERVVKDAAEAVAFFRYGMLSRRDDIRRELRGKNLACFCKLVDQHDNYIPCHADVLLSIANGIPMDEVINENIRRAKGETS